MRVCALVSGGKDSVFCMMECARLGHEVVALANLHPAAAGVQELDSHMFQTVGHNAVVALSQCMGLPLFRIATLGKAVQANVSYATPAAAADVGLLGMACSSASGAPPPDEVEDLHHLLLAVKSCIPSIAAVCSGAVLSNYQRCRVENVCVHRGSLRGPFPPFSLSCLRVLPCRQLFQTWAAVIGILMAAFAAPACAGHGGSARTRCCGESCHYGCVAATLCFFRTPPVLQQPCACSLRFNTSSRWEDYRGAAARFLGIGVL
jgi:uncharacterized protein (TIGR00290 family)